MSDKTEESLHKSPVVKIALIGFLILVVCIAVYCIVVQQRAKKQDITCINDLTRLGFALHLYALGHGGKLPPSWAAASREIAVPLKLHFQGGTENSPVTSIFLANESDQSSYGLHGVTFSVIDDSGPHVAGDVTSEKEDSAKGLFVDYTGTPALLICPGDKSHNVANSWPELTTSNTSYEYVAQDAEWEEPDRVVCVCQIHSQAILADGSVQPYVNHPEWLEKRNGHLYYKRH